MVRWIACSLLLCAGAPLFAQTNSLLIGPGDLLQVDVLETPDMEQQVRVTDQGTVPLAYLGSVHLSGETPEAAAATIKDLLVQKGVMLHPEVEVRVQEYAMQDVSVLGQVKTPGTYAITAPQSILRVLSLAGGLTDIADRHITIKRQEEPTPIDYYVSNAADQALADAVMVRPGDTVLVPKAPVVYIMGDVTRPGGYAIVTLDSKVSLMQAVAIAGSATKTSAQSHVRLIRETPQGTQESTVNLDSIEKGKEPDIFLKPNDIVYVPFSWLKNIAMSSGQIAASTAGAAIYAIP